MDLTEAAAPRSDQLNADDFISGPITVTITEVRIVGGEQPVQIHTEETPDRPWKPSKGMLRVLMAAWGKDEKVFASRRLTLFREPKVKWGGQQVGGIQIAAMSHIDKPLVTSLTTAKGKREAFTVQPLSDAAPEPTAEQVAAETDLAVLRGWHAVSGPGMRAQITARANELKGAQS